MMTMERQSAQDGAFRVYGIGCGQYLPDDPERDWVTRTDGSLYIVEQGERRDEVFFVDFNDSSRWLIERFTGFQDNQKTDLYFGDVLYSPGSSSVIAGLFTVKKDGASIVFESDEQRIMPVQSILHSFTRVGTIHDDIQTLKERAEALK